MQVVFVGSRVCGQGRSGQSSSELAGFWKGQQFVCSGLCVSLELFLYGNFLKPLQHVAECYTLLHYFYLIMSL